MGRPRYVYLVHCRRLVEGILKLTFTLCVSQIILLIGPYISDTSYIQGGKKWLGRWSRGGWFVGFWFGNWRPLPTNDPYRLTTATCLHNHCIHVVVMWLFLLFFMHSLTCCRCLEYMDHLITMLEEHPEVELHSSITDDEENYSVCYSRLCTCSVLPSILKGYWSNSYAFITDFSLMWKWGRPKALMWYQATNVQCMYESFMQ